MSVELDHLFVCVSAGAPEGEMLAAFGLSEGAPNQHPGQGTACRRFFFRNAYLELLWVTNPAEAQAAPVSSTGLWGRWIGRNGASCPFGLCFRPAFESSGNPPFACWEYRPQYLPDGMSLKVGNNAEILVEPGLFYLNVRRRPDMSPQEKRQALEHSAGLNEITRLELIAPNAHQPSPELGALMSAGLVQLRQGAEYVAQLGFDGEIHGKTRDFRPVLPLILSW
jgi:hypothetical protein